MNQVWNRLVTTAVRPYTLRELPGWGKVYEACVGGYARNSQWREAGEREITGKRHGYKMALDLSRWADRSAYFLGRWYDLPTQLLLEAALRPGDAHVDIGANVGMSVLAAAHAVGPEGRIYAFEPNPAPREKLERHVEMNGLDFVEVFPFALDREEGTARFHVPKINSGEGSLAKPSYADDDVSEIIVEKKIGDTILADVSPRLVKIDVEGAEIGVLEGLETLIERAKPVIVCECEETHLARFGTNARDLAAIAARHGYGLYAIGQRRAASRRELTLRALSAEKDLPNRADLAFVQPGDPLLRSAALL